MPPKSVDNSVMTDVTDFHEKTTLFGGLSVKSVTVGHDLGVARNPIKTGTSCKIGHVGQIGRSRPRASAGQSVGHGPLPKRGPDDRLTEPHVSDSRAATVRSTRARFLSMALMKAMKRVCCAADRPPCLAHATSAYATISCGGRP
jgi:hypothetical protein